MIDFELFHPDLKRTIPGSNDTKGGHPPFAHVLIVQGAALCRR